MDGGLSSLTDFYNSSELEEKRYRTPTNPCVRGALAP